MVEALMTTLAKITLELLTEEHFVLCRLRRFANEIRHNESISDCRNAIDSRHSRVFAAVAWTDT